MLAPCWYMPLCGDVKKWIALLILIPVSSLAGQVPPEAPWSGYKPIPNVPNPGYLKTETDPVYGVAITRISDEAAFGASGAAIQHQYAKVQAWNSDMTLLWLGFNKILRASDYTLFKSLDIPMKDGRWANTEPNIRYFCDGEHFRKVDVMNGKVTSLHRFPGFGSCTIGPWEGNISADDRYVVITSQDEKQAAIYDIKNGVVLGEKSFPRTFDWASVTPWGDFVVVNDRRTEDTRLYDLQFNFVRVLSDRRAHADFAVDTGRYRGEQGVRGDVSAGNGADEERRIGRPPAGDNAYQWYLRPEDQQSLDLRARIRARIRHARMGTDFRGHRRLQQWLSFVLQPY